MKGVDGKLSYLCSVGDGGAVKGMEEEIEVLAMGLKTSLGEG
jgi:hypothetical protein